MKQFINFIVVLVCFVTLSFAEEENETDNEEFP